MDITRWKGKSINRAIKDFITAHKNNMRGDKIMPNNQEQSELQKTKMQNQQSTTSGGSANMTNQLFSVDDQETKKLNQESAQKKTTASGMTSSTASGTGSTMTSGTEAAKQLNQQSAQNKGK